MTDDQYDILAGRMPDMPHMPPAWVLDVLNERVPSWAPLDNTWQFCGTLKAPHGALPPQLHEGCQNCGRVVTLIPVVAQTQLKPKNVAATFLYYLGRCDCDRLLWRQPDQGTVNLGQHT